MNASSIPSPAVTRRVRVKIRRHVRMTQMARRIAPIPISTVPLSPSIQGMDDEAEDILTLCQYQRRLRVSRLSVLFMGSETDTKIEAKASNRFREHRRWWGDKRIIGRKRNEYFVSGQPHAFQKSHVRMEIVPVVEALHSYSNCLGT